MNYFATQGEQQPDELEVTLQHTGDRMQLCALYLISGQSLLTGKKQVMLQNL